MVLGCSFSTSSRRATPAVFPFKGSFFLSDSCLSDKLFVELVHILSSVGIPISLVCISTFERAPLLTMDFYFYIPLRFQALLA